MKIIDGVYHSTVTDTTIEGFFGDYRFLSNFWPATITVNYIEYPSVEHAYMAYKTKDMNLRLTLSKVPTGGQVKKFGRQITLREDWELLKTACMLDCVRRKFKHPHLAIKLIATYPKTLIEANNWGDKTWGKVDGEGANALGIILMMVRDELIQGWQGTNYFMYTEQSIPSELESRLENE